MPTTPIAIRAPRFFDGQRFSSGPATVLIDDGRILGIEDGFPAVGERFRMIHNPDSTVLPGLIDTHVHLVADGGWGALNRIAGFTDGRTRRRDHRWAARPAGQRGDDDSGPRRSSVQRAGSTGPAAGRPGRRAGADDHRSRSAADQPGWALRLDGRRSTRRAGHHAGTARPYRSTGRRGEDHGQRRDEHHRHRRAATAVFVRGAAGGRRSGARRRPAGEHPCPCAGGRRAGPGGVRRRHRALQLPHREGPTAVRGAGWPDWPPAGRPSAPRSACHRRRNSSTHRRTFER